MKKLFLCSLLVLSAAVLSFGQAATPSLNTDSTFRHSLLALARYPKTAQEAGKTGRVYVDFTIDTRGQITNIDFLNSNTVDNSFLKAARQLMEQLPVQKPTYAGDYVLPVAFLLEPATGTIHQPSESDRAAFDRTFVQLSHSRSLLNELSVMAYAR